MTDIITNPDFWAGVAIGWALCAGVLILLREKYMRNSK